MEIYGLLDRLEELLDDAPHIPLTGKIILNEEDTLDILDRIRTVLPQEIKETAAIIQERQRIVEEARQEADRLMKECRNQMERMTSEAEVVRLAQAKAKEISNKAFKDAEKIQQGASEYAAEVLGKLEKSLESTLQTVKHGKKILFEPGRKDREGVG